MQIDQKGIFQIFGCLPNLSVFKQSSIKQIQFLLPESKQEIRIPEIPQEELQLAPYYWMIGAIAGSRVEMIAASPRKSPTSPSSRRARSS